MYIEQGTAASNSRDLSPLHPDMCPCQDTKIEEPAPTDIVMPSDVEQHLPGLAADVNKVAFIHFAGEKHADDDLCLAVNARGGRCRRSHGNFCKQHADSAASEETGKAFFGEMEDLIREYTLNYKGLHNIYMI